MTIPVLLMNSNALGLARLSITAPQSSLLVSFALSKDQNRKR
jgi:hypothetical protein